MADNDIKRGFAGLSGMTSDSRDSLHAPVKAKSPNASSVKAETKIFQLLELSKWPTIPSPWSSIDNGETWVWGDFFFNFLKKPKTVFDILAERQGKKAEPCGMTYHYAMAVFYRNDKNPHGISSRPIMIVGLEQADMGMLAKMLGSDNSDAQFEAGNSMGPLMIGLFVGDGRLNFGEYENAVLPQVVKQRFFEILGRQLGLSGQPKMIGDLVHAFGHPETGLPAKKNNSGCLPIILICVGIGGLGLYGFTLIL